MVRIVPFIKHGVCGAAMNCLFKPACKIECSNACVLGEGGRCVGFISLLSTNRSLEAFLSCFDVKSVKYYCFSRINVRGVQVCIKCNLTWEYTLFTNLSVPQHLLM